MGLLWEVNGSVAQECGRCAYPRHRASRAPNAGFAHSSARTRAYTHLNCPAAVLRIPHQTSSNFAICCIKFTECLQCRHG
ncbi:hypothetical protein OH77DRAFT_1423589 [Trametes cingulata]|nr:hypothetical protein OH77DRAFT_1423589 [Trametes cingulata]